MAMPISPNALNWLSKKAHPKKAAEMSDYVTALRSITQGQGVFNRQFYTYEEVPHKQAEEIIAARKTQE